MATAREIMTRAADCATTTETLVDVARRMRMLDVGALLVCGPGGRLEGMVTDRDIVVGCVAAGCDPGTRRAGDLAQRGVVTVAADDSVEQALHTMIRADVRRLPVVDGEILVGSVRLADLARHLPDDTGELVGAGATAPTVG